MSLMADRILPLPQSLEIKQGASSFHPSRLCLLMDPSSRLFEHKTKNFKDKVGALCFTRFFSVFNSVTHPSSTSVHLLPFASSRVWKSDEFIVCGGLPVEVKRESSSASDSAIILYSSSCGRAFITLNYMPRLLPTHPSRTHAGRPWPYHPIILPKRNVTPVTPDI